MSPCSIIADFRRIRILGLMEIHEVTVSFLVDPILRHRLTSIIYQPPYVGQTTSFVLTQLDSDRAFHSNCILIVPQRIGTFKRIVARETIAS